MEEEDEGEEGYVWSWGAGTDGQLGTGRFEDEHLPQRLLVLSFSLPISQFACGGAHVVALSPDGKVLTWGRGTSGQLGHGELGNVSQPKPVKSLESFAVSFVSAGWNHSGFISDSGRLFTCGDGSFGQLGHGNYQSHCSPVEVLYFDSKHVKQIACGMRHSIVLLKGPTGEPLYGFGSGKRGQLGISKQKIRSINLPQVTFGFEDVDIVTISTNGDHSAALSADGQLYTWGRGLGGTSDAYLPHLVISPLRLSHVALGWNHALLLTADGEVFMLGGNYHGKLSNPQKHSLERPHIEGDSGAPVLMKIDGLDRKVTDIAAGAEHSALVTENGEIMTWGWGEHGQLGLGCTDDRTSPQVVNLGERTPNNDTRFNVYCGSGFTFAIRTACLPLEI